jgi:hypothetical protein
MRIDLPAKWYESGTWTVGFCYLTKNMPNDYYGDLCIGDALKEIDNAPTIDTVSVVYGEWQTNSNYPDKLICSVCGYKEDMWWADKGTHYCPNCGKKMKGTP